MKLKTDSGHITVTEADGIDVRNYARMSSDGVLILIDMEQGNRTQYIGICLTPDDALTFAQSVTEMAQRHEAWMAERDTPQSAAPRPLCWVCEQQPAALGKDHCADCGDRYPDQIRAWISER